jgi:hypothetical protein
MYTLIGTAKLNDVGPQAWLADVLACIADTPQSQLVDLLPWNWQAQSARLAAWIRVRPDDRDGRAKRVDMTEPGRVAYAEAIAAIGPELAWLAGVVAPPRVREALPLLAEIRQALDRRRD